MTKTIQMYRKKTNCQSSGWFRYDNYITNNINCSKNTLLAAICIWYLIDYLKYTVNIHAQLFRYLLCYMKPDTISIIISGITDLPL